MSKTCAYLWNHVRMHVDGTILPCCLFDPLEGKGLEIPLINDGIQNAFESELFEDTRDRMLSGEELPECHRCWQPENNGGGSLRLIANKVFDKHIDKPKKIRYIETALSTHCNLACRMCNETFSSKWKLINNPKQSVDTSVDNFELTNYDGDLSELELIKLVGGEPLIDKNHVNFLQMLFDKSKDPSNITLYYNTNGTIKPNAEILEFWKSAKAVRMLFSIDGVGRINEILRPPHKWDTIIKNIEFFKRQDINFIFNVHSALSVLNIKHMIDVIQFSMMNFNTLPEIDFLMQPEHLSLKNLHDDYKEEIIDFINTNYTNVGFDAKPLINFINQDSDFNFTKSDIAVKEKFITTQLKTEHIQSVL